MRKAAFVAFLVAAASAHGDVSTPGAAESRAAREARMARSCADQILAHEEELNHCWDNDPARRHPRAPVFMMVVGANGYPLGYSFFFKDLPATRACLRKTLDRFRFTPFSDADSIAFSSIRGNACLVADPNAPPYGPDRDRGLVDQCIAQVTAHDSEIQRCYRDNTPPQNSTANLKPFFMMVVGADGRPIGYELYQTDPPQMRACLHAVLERFRFTPFFGQPSRALGLLSQPLRCAVVDPNAYPYAGQVFER